MVLYEYPFSEGIRTMLRLEHLLSRLAVLLARDDALDHHFALVTLFEIVDVAARADLKSDLLKELDRHKLALQGFRGHPGVSEQALDEITQRIDGAYQALNQQQGRAGHGLAADEWLTTIRSRISIPAGTCEFDLPAYYAWQQHSPERRRADLQRWIEHIRPLADALTLLLRLLRDTGAPQRVAIVGGHYQQSIPQGKTVHLLRLRIDPALGIVPEISGHRLMVMVRLMRPDADGRLRPTTEEASVDLALCG